MRNTLLFSFAFFLALLILQPAYAQTNDWGRVERLKKGTTLYVSLINGSEVKGKVASVAADSIALVRDGRSTSIARADIARVYRAKRGSILKRTLIGAAAGAGVGMLVGAGVVAATKGDGLIAAGGFLYGIPAGAAIGAATAGKKRGELIYSFQ